MAKKIHILGHRIYANKHDPEGTYCGLPAAYATVKRKARDDRLYFIDQPNKELDAGASLCLWCAVRAWRGVYERGISCSKNLEAHARILNGRYRQ